MSLRKTKLAIFLLALGILSSTTAFSAGMTGKNSCVYVSKVALSYACISDDNPLGYYFVVTHRKGDKITPMAHAWWADYKGRGVVCPLRDKKSTWVQCGFPPE